MLDGGAGSDTYIFNLGDGVDTIADVAGPGEGNLLVFGPGISRYDLKLHLEGTELVIEVGANGDQVHLLNFDGENQNGTHVVEKVQFADRTQINLVELLDPGTEGNDIIITGPSDDVIRAKGGDDYVSTDGGNDCVDAGSGNDVVLGGDGSDVLIGGTGNDLLDGGTGDSAALATGSTTTTGPKTSPAQTRWPGRVPVSTVGATSVAASGSPREDAGALRRRLGDPRLDALGVGERHERSHVGRGGHQRARGMRGDSCSRP